MTFVIENSMGIQINEGGWWRLIPWESEQGRYIREQRAREAQESRKKREAERLEREEREREQARVREEQEQVERFRRRWAYFAQRVASHQAFLKRSEAAKRGAETRKRKQDEIRALAQEFRDAVGL